MSTSETTLPPALVTRPRRRWPVVVLWGALVLFAAVIAAALIPVSYYELVPGQAMSVAGLITVPSGKGHPPHGKVLLTDVGLVDNLRLLGYLEAMLDPNASLVKTAVITENLPVSEFDAQGNVDMAESQLTAEAVALRQLGYAVPEHDVGVTVYVLDPGSPAYAHLQVGDVISAIDGVPTTNPEALAAAVRAHQPGQVVTLRVGSIDDPLPGRDVPVRLASMREEGKVVAFLGIGDPQSLIAPMGTQPVYDMPFPISINSDNIGGPSAGLAWTLGIINTLAGGDLTGGRIIAATGTIRPDGTVGDVGGVAQKTVAVEQAGATVFLVPDPEVAVARSKATPGLKVFGVASLAQALGDIRSLGGHLGSAATGPPPGPGGHSVPYDWQDSPWS